MRNRIQIKLEKTKNRTLRSKTKIAFTVSSPSPQAEADGIIKPDWPCNVKSFFLIFKRYYQTQKLIALICRLEAL
jgi:hypothetical protein